jgi:hypothetical protein
MIIPNIWKNKSHVPNHQPDIYMIISICIWINNTYPSTWKVRPLHTVIAVSIICIAEQWGQYRWRIPFFSFRSMKVRNYIQLKMLLHAFTICSMATNQPNWENPSIYPLAIQHSNGKSAPFRGDFATFYLYMRQQFEDFLVLSTSWLKKSCPNPLEYHHFPIN